MYYSYYGLKDNPFELAPDGSYLYMSETHKEGLATLRYGVIANKGFLLLTGGVGVGKTTILNALLGMLEKKVVVCLLNNPRLNKEEFYLYLASKLDLAYDGNKSSFVLEFEKLLIHCRETGEKTLLVIDEAQAFSVELLEEVRLLSNLAGPSNVFSIFLVGQPEIREQLATSQLLPLRQRIGIRYHVESLSGKDTEQYINFRLNRAGADKTAIFTAEAVATIHEASQGNPRLINILCDHAMLTGFAKDLKVIDKSMIIESLEELRLPGEATLQTSEMRSRTIIAQPSPSDFIKQPSPQPPEFTSQPSEIANQSDSLPLEKLKREAPQPTESRDQTPPQESEEVPQPKAQSADPADDSTPQTIEVSKRSKPPQIDLESRPNLQSGEVITQQEPLPTEVESQSDYQQSEVSSQTGPEHSAVKSEPTSQIKEVENQTSPQPTANVNLVQPRQSEVAKPLKKKGNPVVHFTIALVIMSVIIIMGIILPIETLDLLSGV